MRGGLRLFLVAFALAAGGKALAQAELPPRNAPLFPEAGPVEVPPVGPAGESNLPRRADPLFPDDPELDPPTDPRPSGEFPRTRGDRNPRAVDDLRNPDWPQRPNLERSDEFAPRYRVWWFPEEGVKGQAARLTHVRQELDVPIPFLLEKTDLFGASVRVRNTLSPTRAVLPNTGNPFPRNLWDVSVGLGYLHYFDNGVSAGVLPRLGSASDRPFLSTRELTFSTIAFVRVPAPLIYGGEGDFWNFSIFYFPNSQIRFPIPGVAYEWNPNPDVKVSLGIPLSVRWRFADEWQFDFGYRPVTQITTRLTYEPRPGFRFYGAFDWDADGYYLAGRPNREDLFFLQDKRLTLGTRFDVAENLTLDLSGGYAFDRNYGVGRNSLHYRYDQIGIDSGGFLSAWLLLQF